MNGPVAERRAPTALIGTVLADRWTVVKALGVGGTAAVYEAVHRNGRRVAVKVLHAELADHPVVRRRFQSEGYAANRVRHPDAVAVLDDGESQGHVFLVMELLEGRSLARRLAEAGALPATEVARIALGVLDILAAAHEQGVVHRDVKPANIFLTDAGRVKLLDFGVAHVDDSPATSVITQVGSTVGTPAFMAPEQAAGRSEEVDALTDIWAVGATMFQLLSKRVVHDISSNNGVLVAAATKPAPELRSVVPGVPAAMARVVDRALAFARADRWPNALAMRRALLELYPESGAERAAPPASPPTEPELSGALPAASPPMRPLASTPTKIPGRVAWLIVASLLLVALAWSRLRTPPPLPAPLPAHSGQPTALSAPPPAPALAPESPASPATAWPDLPAALPAPPHQPREAARHALTRVPSPQSSLPAPTLDDSLLDRRK